MWPSGRRGPSGKPPPALELAQGARILCLQPASPVVFSSFSFLPCSCLSFGKVLKSWKVGAVLRARAGPDGSQNLSWVLTLFLAFRAKMEEEK